MTKKLEFSKKMTDILNYGALNLAMAIGYRTGLFDSMDAFDGPRPLADIAEKAGLNRRYIREWLGVMVCGGVVELSRGAEGEDLFHLPKAHGDLIARRAGTNNLGVYTQEMPILTACALEPVMEGFSTGQGVSYEHYPTFQAFMGQLADAKHRETLVDKFLPSVDGGRIVQQLREGITVCDLGCGEGTAVLLMAEAFPKSRFTGTDISKEALETARTGARRRSLENAQFRNLDAAAMADRDDLSGVFDYITAFDAIHDQTRPLAALRGAYHCLKPGGAFSMIDIAAGSRMRENADHPMGPFLYTVSLMHCMPVGLVDGGAGLGMMWGEERAVEMLGQAGFADVTVAEIPDDPFNRHFFCRK